MIYQSVILVSNNTEAADVVKSLLLPAVAPADIWQNSQLEQSSISIQTIQELNGWLALMPYSSEIKLAIIWQAEKLTTEAQNALLKNLEEPAKSTQIVLVTAFPLKLLPTILSRCQLVKDVENLAKKLQNEFTKKVKAWNSSNYLKKINLIQTWLKEQKREWFIKFSVQLLEHELKTAKEEISNSNNTEKRRERIMLLKQIYAGLEHNANLQPALETLALAW